MWKFAWNFLKTHKFTVGLFSGFQKKSQKLRLCCVNCSTFGDGKKAICLFKNHHIWRYHFDFQSKDVLLTKILWTLFSRLEIIMLYDGEETVESDLQLYCSEWQLSPIDFLVRFLTHFSRHNQLTLDRSSFTSIVWDILLLSKVWIKSWKSVPRAT